jgi:tungstate transport system ATP-binding protein
MTIVEVRDLRVDYDGRAALDIPALDVREHEALAVIGPNGAGKSTLLRVLGLLERPAGGTIRFRGETVDRSRELAQRRRMASVFQDPHLADATVFDNAALGLRFRRIPRREAEARVARWLDRLAIGGLRHRQARTLSGGEAQRVALARALVLEPDLLLLDEPFSSLDHPTRDRLIQDFGDVLREDRITTVLVTHDRGEALALADRVGVLIDGRLLQLDDTAQVFRAPASEEVARFVGVETIVDCLAMGQDGELSVLEAGGRLIEVAQPSAPGERVRLCLRPEDVTLTAGRPASGASSARNRLGGSVMRLIPSGPHVRVMVDCGFALVALVTPRSVEDLNLKEGTPVTAQFKATAPHLLRARKP